MENSRKDATPRKGGTPGLYMALAGTALSLAGGAFYFFTKSERGFRFVLDRMYRREFQNVEFVTPEELALELEGPTPPVLLDIRTPEEYAVSHLGDARLAAPATFGPADLFGLKKETPIVVYCSVGYRSGKIAELLADMGFRNVRNLYGGIFLWFNQDRPVFSSGLPVDRIHTYDRRWGQFVTRGEKIFSIDD